MKTIYSGDATGPFAQDKLLHFLIRTFDDALEMYDQHRYRSETKIILLPNEGVGLKYERRFDVPSKAGAADTAKVQAYGLEDKISGVERRIVEAAKNYKP